MAMFPTSKLYIDGAMVEAEGGRTYPNITPWTGEEIGQVADASLNDLDRAIAAARRAFDDTDWSSNHEKRLAILDRFKDVMRSRSDRFGEIAPKEVGCSLGGLFTAQRDKPLQSLDDTFQIARNYKWEELIGKDEFFGVFSHRYVWKEAVGVVGAITPWNVPMQINLAKIYPALCAGCTVVLKPAPETPYLAALLGECAIEAGLPAGVFNVITSGSKAEIGEALVADPRVDMISFTGSTAVGKRIMEVASKQVKQVFLELGGKSANIILDDEDFAANVGSAVWALYHAGQGCANLTRVLIPRNRYQEAVDILTPIFENFAYGDPDAYDQVMGPIVSKRQQERVLEYIEIGKKEGARVAAGGKAPTHLGPGFFVEPTLLVDVTNDMRVAREEIFGPVLCLIAYDDDEDAIRIANDSEFGLSGGVCGRDEARVAKIARRLRTGTIGVNGGMWLSGHAPFGGYKQSGIGRESGVEGFEEYIESKVVAFKRDNSAAQAAE